MYADDILVFSSDSGGLQSGLNILPDKYDKLKQVVNTYKTKTKWFNEKGNLPRNFRFNRKKIEIVKQFVYFVTTFTTGGSFNETHKILSGQVLKAMFELNQYLYHFNDLSPSHILIINLFI